MRIHESTLALEEAAQGHLKRLTRDYLNAPRLSRADERRLWSIHSAYFTLLAQAFERCLPDGDAQPKVRDALKAQLPQTAVHLLAALCNMHKWDCFRYEASAPDLWQRSGRVLLLCEAAGVDGRSIPFGRHGGSSSPRQEYLRAMVFHAASVDSLLPLEIELAERLITHFLPEFAFTATAESDSVYWVDLESSQPPLRLARMPGEARSSQRFFKPGKAYGAMQDLLRLLEQGGDLPAEINLGGQYQARTLIPVLRHLTAYLAPIPPQRRHDRHRVKHRMAVLPGLVNAFVVFSRDFSGRPVGLPIQSSVVENVSRGGFGALLTSIPGEWLSVGALIAMQPEGGDNWLLGVVRRYHRETESEARVGIETLALEAVALEVTPRASSSFTVMAGMPALLLVKDGGGGEVSLLLPPASFDLREQLEYQDRGVLRVLQPVALVERTGDYDLARYRFVAPA